MIISELYGTIRPRYPEFKDRVALVTGSSMGIGKGIALRLAREGMQIIIHGREQDEVSKTVAELQSLGVRVQGFCSDFAELDGVDRLFDAVRAHHDGLYLLVNNAADLRRTHIDEVSISMLDNQLHVNIRAQFLCCMQAVPMMRPQKTGAIINISSVGGQRAHWRGLPYDVTKGALEAMTRAMSLELARDGIRVNAVAPGAIRSSKTPPPNHETVIEREERIPMGRIGGALEVGAVVAFLASDDASYITGQVLNVDGGITAQLSPPGQPI